MVKRGLLSEFQPVESSALAHELERAEIVIDDGARVSVLARHYVDVDSTDTLLGRLHGGAPTMSASPLLWTAAGLVSVALTAASLPSTGAWSLVAVASPVVGIVWVAANVAFLNLSVARRLLDTAWFRWRALTCVLGNVALAVALDDVRSLIAVSSALLQITAFAGDALVHTVQRQRLAVAASALLNALVVVALIVSGLVPSRWLVWTVSPTFDYQLMQLVRDVHAAQIIVLLFELQSLARGAHRRRFLHIGAPVSMAILPVTHAPVAPARAKRAAAATRFKAGASRVELNQSGFFVKQQSLVSAAESQNAGSDDAAPLPAAVDPVMLFVDVVELQQSDALAIHALGFALGKRFFIAVVGPVGWAVGFVAYAVNWAALLSFAARAAMPAGLPLMSIAASLLFAAVSFSVMSRTVLLLLLQRRHFRVTAVFLALWFGLICAVMQDERIAVAIFVLQVAVVDALSDAKTTMPGRHGRLSRTFEKLNAGLFFLVLAVFQVQDVIASRQLYVVFRPDLVDNATAVNADAPFVVDTAQVLVDLEISFVLEKLVGFAIFVWRARPEQFQVVSAPVCRSDAEGSGSKTSAAT